MIDLESFWCLWCHVMDVTTYRSLRVITLAPLQVLDCEVDQDSRPDLYNRYEDHGWPATVVFDGDGQIVKRQGYLPPEGMASMLNASIDGPTPGPSVQREAEMFSCESSALRRAEGPTQ